MSCRESVSSPVSVGIHLLDQWMTCIICGMTPLKTMCTFHHKDTVPTKECVVDLTINCNEKKSSLRKLMNVFWIRKNKKNQNYVNNHPSWSLLRLCQLEVLVFRTDFILKRKEEDVSEAVMVKQWGSSIVIQWSGEQILPLDCDTEHGGRRERQVCGVRWTSLHNTTHHKPPQQAEHQNR